MGEIYERMDDMLGEIKDVMKENAYSSYYPEVEKIVVDRWDKMTIPVHCLGFALNPRFYHKIYLDKLAPAGLARKAPNEDVEVVRGVMDTFTKIAKNDEEDKLLREKFTRFHTKKGIYSMVATQANSVTMDAIYWWSSYEAETRELAEVAKKVLSQPISSSSAERNWSTYSYIHNDKRNRLNSKRSDKLVFIHSNIRLLSQFSEDYKSGPYKKWDVQKVGHESGKCVCGRFKRKIGKHGMGKFGIQRERKKSKGGRYLESRLGLVLWFLKYVFSSGYTYRNIWYIVPEAYRNEPTPPNRIHLT
ncbi:hypothetical protein OSB04_002899 [Centaurea solstitialis]|uniref:HAT C-terminal dimerisation domain-containing protein n=1 Tax=Centaurea solstitialis TaxID=347529 RepID=A0AA38UBW4_9ASTR|nr:hypothetical protein OSB04_002899 [Centaurea solstitialis]